MERGVRGEVDGRKDTSLCICGAVPASVAATSAATRPLFRLSDRTSDSASSVTSFKRHELHATQLHASERAVVGGGGVDARRWGEVWVERPASGGSVGVRRWVGGVGVERAVAGLPGGEAMGQGCVRARVRACAPPQPSFLSVSLLTLNALADTATRQRSVIRIILALPSNFWTRGTSEHGPNVDQGEGGE